MCDGVLHHTEFSYKAAVSENKKGKLQKPQANPCVGMNACFVDCLNRTSWPQVSTVDQKVIWHLKLLPFSAVISISIT